MAKALFTNNASGTLAAAITTTGATSLVLNGGQGALFPAPSGGNYFYATIIDASNNKEIVKVTVNVADTFTMVRAQDGTTARTFAIGSKVELRPCAAVFAERLPPTEFTEGTVASATSVNLETSGLYRQSVTGSINITGFTGANMKFRLRLTGNPLFTYNATSLITPTGADYQGASGDIVDLEIDGSNNTRIVAIQRGAFPQQGNFTGVNCAVATQLLSFSIPAGKWKVSFSAFENAGGPGSILASFWTATATIGGTLGLDWGDGAVEAVSGRGCTVMTSRILTLTTATTYYLNGLSTCASSSMYGVCRVEPII